MNSKLPAALALSTGSASAQSITLPEMPLLEGPRADQIQRFNEAMRDWKSRAEVQLTQQILKTTSAQG
jgi:hypothetical protein